MTWLVTGGAGYIGGHVVQRLRARDEAVVVLDDLRTGRRERLPADVPLVEASVLDAAAVRAALHEHRVTGVIHLAAGKAVEESVARPLLYYRENVAGFLVLLEEVVSAGVRDVVLSSSAAVYGTPTTATVPESSPTVPESPYGETKLADEWLLRAAGRAHGLRWAALRYFNVVGADSPRLGDVGATNLVPKVFKALDAGVPPVVYGDDYPTRDGSCVRDYVHVVDLADAHVRTMDVLRADTEVGVVNIGTGRGATVKEVLDVVGEVIGDEVAYDVVGRRPGDPAEVVAAVDRARSVLEWESARGLEDMVASAWTAWRGRTG